MNVEQILDNSENSFDVMIAAILSSMIECIFAAVDVVIDYKSIK